MLQAECTAQPEMSKASLGFPPRLEGWAGVQAQPPAWDRLPLGVGSLPTYSWLPWLAWDGIYKKETPWCSEGLLCRAAIRLQDRGQLWF